jgi:hypothetical protein
MAHPLFTLLAAVILSAAFAMVEDRTPRERLYAAARMLLCCGATIFAGGWLMRLIHG